MAEKRRWTYGHAWFTWEMVRRADRAWKPERLDFMRAWNLDSDPAFSPSSCGLAKERTFREPVLLARRWVAPRNYAVEAAELRWRVEPLEAAPVRALEHSDIQNEHGRRFHRIAVDLCADEGQALDAVRRELRRERREAGVRMRGRPRGGRDPWGVLGPPLAINYLEHVEDGGSFATWFKELDRTLLPTVKSAAGETQRTREDVRRNAAKVLGTMQKAIRDDPFVAYRLARPTSQRPPH